MDFLCYEGHRNGSLVQTNCTSRTCRFCCLRKGNPTFDIIKVGRTRRRPLNPCHISKCDYAGKNSKFWLLANMQPRSTMVAKCIPPDTIGKCEKISYEVISFKRVFANAGNAFLQLSVRVHLQLMKQSQHACAHRGICVNTNMHLHVLVCHRAPNRTTSSIMYWDY